MPGELLALTKFGEMTARAVYGSGTQLFDMRDRFHGRQLFHGEAWVVVQVVMQAIGSDGEQQMKLRSLPATHLLLCGLVPNRPRTSVGPQPKDWGPFVYGMDKWPDLIRC